MLTLSKVLISVCLSLAACNTPASTPTGTELAPDPTQSPIASSSSLLVDFEGEEFDISSEFQLESDVSIDISWDYSGQGSFAIWIVNTNEFGAVPPNDRILVVNVDGPTQGSSQIELIAGSYVVEVELADGPWKISATKTQ